jgi:hypothetical protein
MRLILSEDFHSHYLSIREGLIELEEKWGGSFPEEIYHSCMNGESYLVLVENGFLVVREDLDDRGEKELFIWSAYSFSGCSAIKDNLQDIKDLAMSVDAKKIAFCSVRSGWERVLKDDVKIEFIKYSIGVGDVGKPQ